MVFPQSASLFLMFFTECIATLAISPNDLMMEIFVFVSNTFFDADCSLLFLTIMFLSCTEILPHPFLKGIFILAAFSMDQVLQKLCGKGVFQYTILLQSAWCSKLKLDV
jgi:hypothetical protein